MMTRRRLLLGTAAIGASVAIPLSNIQIVEATGPVLFNGDSITFTGWSGQMEEFVVIRNVARWSQNFETPSAGMEDRERDQQ